jgi:hypothetical protein
VTLFASRLRGLARGSPIVQPGDTEVIYVIFEKFRTLFCPEWREYEFRMSFSPIYQLPLRFLKLQKGFISDISFGSYRFLYVFLHRVSQARPVSPHRPNQNDFPRYTCLSLFKGFTIGFNASPESLHPFEENCIQDRLLNIPQWPRNIRRPPRITVTSGNASCNRRDRSQRGSCPSVLFHELL